MGAEELIGTLVSFNVILAVEHVAVVQDAGDTAGGVQCGRGRAEERRPPPHAHGVAADGARHFGTDNRDREERRQEAGGAGTWSVSRRDRWRGNLEKRGDR